MSQLLPTHGFHFLQREEIASLILKDLPDDGYILEVDLHYPTSLHNQHDAPESLVINRNMYLPTQLSVFPECAPQQELTPNLMNKSKYVVHYRNLNFISSWVLWSQKYIKC